MSDHEEITTTTRQAAAESPRDPLGDMSRRLAQLVGDAVAEVYTVHRADVRVTGEAQLALRDAGPRPSRIALVIEVQA